MLIDVNKEDNKKNERLDSVINWVIRRYRRNKIVVSQII
jgi:hypothetical protein